ncbi:MAG TPA: hypothetical protein VHB97_10205 [Polyangia bacterium]|jgi:hypothetical protein|nr:hypothetical protein [Polyangia bacterium]
MKHTSRHLAFALLFGATACGGSNMAKVVDASANGDSSMFMAEDSDFADWQSWFGGVLAPNLLDGDVYPPGTRWGYVNHRVPPGTSVYPEGTVLIKLIESPKDDPTLWHAFGFAKRGGGYNAAGAVGWEFFLLRLDAAGTPTIQSRGIAPAFDGFDMDSGSYTPGGSAGSCNICHQLPAFKPTDYIIDALLAPGSTLVPVTSLPDAGTD